MDLGGRGRSGGRGGGRGRGGGKKNPVAHHNETEIVVVDLQGDPVEALELIRRLIADTGSRLVAQVVEGANESGTEAEASFNRIMADVTKASTHVETAVRDKKWNRGTTMLGLLQAAAWSIDEFILSRNAIRDGVEEGEESGCDAKCTCRASAADGEQWPVEELFDGGPAISGVMLNRRTKGDH
jgi:hypothetical protein